MKNKLKEIKGITLIALVITIVVLLILAGVSIATLTGENGILTQANTAKEKNKEAEAEEIFKLIANEWQIEKRKTGARDLKKFLEDEASNYGVEVEDGTVLVYKGQRIIIDSEGNLTEEPLTVEELQKENKFEYYSTLSNAITDANNGTQDNADTDKENAVAGIYTDKNGEINVVLMKNTTLNSRLTISRDMTINLGGKLLTFVNESEATALVGIDGVSGNKNTITIDGRLSGSRIHLESSVGKIRIVQTQTSNTFIINGGKYTANYSAESISEGPTFAGIFCMSDGKLNMKNATVETTTSTLGTVDNVLVAAAIQNVGEAELTNCTIKSYSNYYAENGKKTTYSIGIENNPKVR